MDSDLDVKGWLSVEHLALYREWRPQSFRDVIGQEHVCRTLQNAVRQGRVAHAYLFCGPRGTGKTSTARILAKAINCPDSQDGEPCNTCTSCRSTTAGISMDVIEMDAASHRGIEEIRDLNQKVCFAPTAGKSRLFIIDEVHMLTGEAFNALLKTLEEPPRHTIFILATTEAHKVPLTIVSRCQRFDFRRLSRDVINDHLRRVAGEKGWQIDDDALELLSRHAGGALRDALGLLEQAASFTGGAISRIDLETLIGAISPESLRSLLAAAMTGDASSLLQQLDELSARGCEPRQVLYQLIDLVRDRLFAAATPGPERNGYANLLRGLAAAEADLKGNSRPDLVLELALVRFSDAPAIPAPGSAGCAPASSSAGSSVPSGHGAAPASGRQTGDHAPAETSRGAVSKSVTDAIGTGAPGKPAATSAGQPSLQEQATIVVSLGELRKILGQVFQNQPIESQDLASCEFERDGDKIVLKASSAFQQERLLKDENRRKLQDALRQRHPALELEIAWALGAPEQSSSHMGGGCSPQVPGARRAPETGAASTEPGTATLEGAAQPRASGKTSPRQEPHYRGGQERAPGAVQESPDGKRTDEATVHKADLSDLLDREASPDTNRPVSSPDSDKEQTLDNGQQATLGRKNEAEQKTAPGRRPEERQIDEGQVDPVVGVALTLFNGKIIDETEAG
jgi:DNA polymerase-3 subunit gamma/tau